MNDLTGTNQMTETKHTTLLDGQRFKYFIASALTWLKTNQEHINSLNVFPVPDGDTGTNMVLTMQSALNEISASEEHNVGKMAHALAQGALMGARGNSGVILSQLWRGFARALDSAETADAAMIVSALEEARNTAYKGVVRPVEGTILTVATDIAKRAREAIELTSDSEVLLGEIVKAADESVKRTPDLLDKLKEAGVVDSGGKGLFIMLEGIQRQLNNQSLEIPLVQVTQLSAMNVNDIMESIEPGQDYEVVVDFEPNEMLDLEKFYSDLGEIGTSIQVGEGDGFYRMHIHVPAEKKYQPIEYTMSIGTVHKVAIENLIAQMEARGNRSASPFSLTRVEPGQIAVVTISPGLGISHIFASLGAAAIVEGGQTMNPSTEEILKAFEDLPTDKIIILPNNKNIILAAQQAAGNSVKNVVVIPSMNIPQGLSALLHLIPDGNMDDIVSDMQNALTDVETGEITTATRDVTNDGIEVRKGEVIALHNGKIICCNPGMEDSIFYFLDEATSPDHERITLYYGLDISADSAEKLAVKIGEKYPAYEIEFHEGSQPHYFYIISVE
jgi:uncharacterized protein